MNKTQQVMNHYLVQIIKNLKNNGIEDITLEDLTARSSNGKLLKVRFYTEEQWLSNPLFKASLALRVMKEDYKGSKKPDHKVEYDGQEYLVKVLEDRS